jgi:hypothetical protein
MSGGMGFLGHELGALLAHLVSETELLGHEALRGLRSSGDEEARRAIERRLVRLRAQRREIGRMIDVFSLLDASRAGSLQLDIQTVPATTLVEAVVDTSAALRSALALNRIAETAIVCDRDYMTTALRCLLDASFAMRRARGSKLPSRISLRFDRQRNGTYIAMTFPGSLTPDPNDIRVELARQIAELHEGGLSSDGENLWTLFLPAHLRPGRRLVGRGPRRPTGVGEGSADS